MSKLRELMRSLFRTETASQQALREFRELDVIDQVNHLINRSRYHHEQLEAIAAEMVQLHAKSLGFDPDGIEAEKLMDVILCREDYAEVMERLLDQRRGFDG